MATPYEFPSDQAAEDALSRAGCSLGRQQRDAPRGILYGDFDIQKWKNLSTDDRAALHGVYRRLQYAPGPVEVTLSRQCPVSVKKVVAAAAARTS